MSLSDPNRPLRVFDKVLHGGLGAGHIGIVMARHGTGKVAMITSIAIDHALSGVNTLHVAVGESVSDVRAFDDEVLHEMLKAFEVGERGDLMTQVERHKQIYTYRNGDLSARRLRDTLEFLERHAEFRPGLIEIQGWPDFEALEESELRALRGIAAEYQAEIWLMCHTTRDQGPEGQEAPPHLARFEHLYDVLIGLEPVAERVHLRFLKTHDYTPPKGVHLEFDPQSMLIRWH